MSAYPPGLNPGQPPQPWNPGMGPPPPSDPSQLPPASDQPPQNVPKIPDYPEIPGYVSVTFGKDTPVKPPPQPPPQGNPPPMTFTDLANLDEESCRQAMYQFVSEHCCYGSKPAKEMKITDFKGITALHYILETFAEGRTTMNAHTPYLGGPVDGPENGPPPLPWTIPCDPDQKFRTHSKKIEVPHTSVVCGCTGCDQRGWNWCWRCGGRGRAKCTTCGGDGRVQQYDSQQQRQVAVMCHRCHGDGLALCMTCGGDGRVTCSTCQGYRFVRCYILLTVAYTNHKEDFILETSDMPDELVRNVSGTIIFEDVQPMVWPITSYPVPEINANSQRLVSSHRGQWPSEKILSQRQTLRGVPVTEVAYTWEGQSMRYWVYGKERRVYCPDYPHQCCWGCSIL